MATRNVILIEFNELTPSLLKQFIEAGHLPNFQRFYETSTIFTTDAQATYPYLEPWIQWLTIHSGLDYTEHKVTQLGQGRQLVEKGLAEILSDAGLKVGVFGSMNLNYSKLNGYLLPDPWDAEGKAYPAFLQPFYDVIRQQVQESTRPEKLTKKTMLQLGLFMLRHGLSWPTGQAIVKQLWQERQDKAVKWRRAMLLDYLQYDIFRQLNRRFKTEFATFFSNSTAHFQHYYWRDMEPALFEVAPPAGQHPSLRNSILAGYQSMDRLLEQFLRDFPDALLILCTALSQQPWTDTTKCTFRPKDFGALLEFAGLDPATVAVKPVMAEEFHIECRSAAEADLVEQRLLNLSVSGKPLLVIRRTGLDMLAGCAIYDETTVDLKIFSPQKNATRSFDDLFYMVSHMRSGRHHPDGALWVRNGHHQVVEEKVSLLEIAPAILNHFGVEKPAYMRGAALPLQ